MSCMSRCPKVFWLDCPPIFFYNQPKKTNWFLFVASTDKPSSVPVSNAVQCPWLSVLFEIAMVCFFWAMCNRITNLTCVGFICSQVPFFFNFWWLFHKVWTSFSIRLYDWLIRDTLQAFHQFQEHSDSKKTWVGSEVRIPYLVLWWNGCARLIKPIEWLRYMKDLCSYTILLAACFWWKYGQFFGSNSF